MVSTTMKAQIYTDNTGVFAELPIIVTDEGPLEPLVDFYLDNYHVKSFSWMQKTNQAVGLLLDYMAANHKCFDEPKVMFRNFLQRLYSGTIGTDGLDPTGLYWPPRTSSSVSLIYKQLTTFSDWLVENIGAKPISPWREATSYETMLNCAATTQRRNRAFLAHAWRKATSFQAAKRTRSTLVRRPPTTALHRVKHFPDNKFLELLFRGFVIPGKKNSGNMAERLNLRDVLITILMHCGGVRISEPFHIFLQDIQVDLQDTSKAMVRIFHPSEGAAPADWKDPTGKKISGTREAYLHALYRLKPRTSYLPTHPLHAGWKGNLLDDSAGKYMHIHWNPSWAGELFLRLWRLYLLQRVTLGSLTHPFAFVTKAGNPYTIDAFRRSYNRAVERIGLVQARHLGTSPHGSRHAYGQRTVNMELNPIVIQKAFHHKSIESQLKYTEPTLETVTEIMNERTHTLNEGISAVPPDLLAYGFNDVDPLELFSGKHPKLKVFDE